MIPVLSRAQMRAFDRFAIDTCHVPSVVLMENAGRGAADIITSILRGVPAQGRASARRVVIVCGTGNNGGDGFVVARHLETRGVSVEVFLTGPSTKVTGDARVHLDAFVDLGGQVRELVESASLEPLVDALKEAEIGVDALFGTGLDRPIQGHLEQVVRALNASLARRVALDVPSGLDADSGQTLGIAVEAHDTVTFGHLKLGLLTPEGARLSGRVHVVDLGVPDARILPQVGHSAEVIEARIVASWMKPRAASVHKHGAGDVLVIAGSEGKTGAALLASSAALRSGAGLATIATFPEAAASLEARVLETMVLRLDPNGIEASLDRALERRSAVVVGPGFGLDERARAAVDHVVLSWEGPKVVDADAITLFAGRAEVLAQARGKLVLTPHPGELARLLGTTSREVEGDRFEAVRAAVSATNATVVLKGARTIVLAPNSRPFVCTAGNPALATAGSGDVLAGVVAAFACALPIERAAVAGVLVHALTGDAWRADAGSDRGLIASDLVQRIPEALASLLRTNEAPLG